MIGNSSAGAGHGGRAAEGGERRLLDLETPPAGEKAEGRRERTGALFGAGRRRKTGAAAEREMGMAAHAHRERGRDGGTKKLLVR